MVAEGEIRLRWSLEVEGTSVAEMYSGRPAATNLSAQSRCHCRALREVVCIGDSLPQWRSSGGPCDILSKLPDLSLIQLHPPMEAVMVVMFCSIFQQTVC